jgi:hypothetical protein
MMSRAVEFVAAAFSWTNALSNYLVNNASVMHGGLFLAKGGEAANSQLTTASKL